MYRSIVGWMVWLLVMGGPVASLNLAQTATTGASGAALATLDIKAPTIPSTRGMPAGTLTVAQHFGLSPK